MRGETRFLTSLGLILGLIPRAGAEGLTASVTPGAVPAHASEIHTEIGEFRDAVAGTSVTNERVARKAYDLFNEGVPGSQVTVKVALRGWDTEKGISGGTADENKIVSAAQRRLMEIKAVPAPEFSEANSYVLRMTGTEKLAFAKDLSETHMGVYRYMVKSAALGDISLNESLRWIAGKVGEVFAFATVIHEAAHARDHQKGALKPDSVVAGEVLAFQTQYLWLKMVDPYGERLALIRAVLADEMRRSPSALTEAALKYATALHVLEGTGGDESKVREYVDALGYSEHDHAHEGAGPSSPSA